MIMNTSYNKETPKNNSTMEAPGLKDAIRERNWEETSRILKDHPELAKEALSYDEFNVLWSDAPPETIQVLLEAWPEAYEKIIYFDGALRDLVEKKLFEKEWDFLDKIFQEFPQVFETKYASTATKYGASLEFLTKHWKENGVLLYFVYDKNWETFGEMLNDNLQLVKEELSEDEFTILWSDAPLELIRALLEAWPDSCRELDGGWRNLVDAKLYQKEWDFLDSIFQEFPQALEMYYARKTAKYGAPLEFLKRHWEETGVLLYSVYNKDWEKFGEILNEHRQLAKAELSGDEFDVICEHAPLGVIQGLLQARPDAFEINKKIREKEWDFLKSLIHVFPNVVTADNVLDACLQDAPVDVFRLMLEQQPNAPLEYPYITFELMTQNKLDHFCVVADRCPAVTELKDRDLHLTPLLYVFQKKERMSTDWIGPILKANPNAAKQKDFDGKTALHLAYQHGASPDLIDMIQQAYPKAENERDNLGRFPKDLENQSEKTAFTPANAALILRDNLNIEKSYPDNAVVVCRGDMLIRDPQIAENEEERKTFEEYSKQVLARHRIFKTLLDEFSKMVGIDDKDVIQKAAAIQALAAQCLSNKNGTIINFGKSDNPGYWYQQEVLKLVMRVYHETQSRLDYRFPSITEDAWFCIDHLDDMDNGEASPEPGDKHVKAYDELTRWLTNGLDSSSCSLQGPALKPLQSLFNKLFIRRGQTSVHIIGDMVRGTLLLDNTAMLDEVVKRIKNTFPNITENQFRHPDACNGLAEFLTYVHDDLDFLPDSNYVLPYRFKANSSQKEKEKPLWYNLNFFLQIPEYHRVGFSEMFVACELQIGLTEEINKHRSVHDAYERDRILSNQPLLKNYDAMSKVEEGEDKFSQLVNCTEDDNQMIEKVLFGKIASEVLIPCTTKGNDDKKNILLFENGPFRLSEDAVEAGTYVKPERQHINNRSLNWHALECLKEDGYVAMVVAGPYKLDETKRHFVDSFVFEESYAKHFSGTVGLHACVGPYLIQIACSYVRNRGEDYIEAEDMAVIKSGQNFSYLEQMCPVPAGTTALEVIAYGAVSDYGKFKWDKMNLSLQVFDIQ